LCSLLLAASAHNPPHEQWLARLDVGAGSWAWCGDSIVVVTCFASGVVSDVVVCSDVACTWCHSAIINAHCFLSFPCLLWYGGGAVVCHLSSPVCCVSFIVPALLAARTCNPPHKQWLARLEAGSFVIDLQQSPAIHPTSSGL